MSCVVVLLLIVIALLLWRLKRASPNKVNSQDKYTRGEGDHVVFHETPHNQGSEPGTYMELHPRQSEGESRAPPEYQTLRGPKANPEYCNASSNKGSTAQKMHQGKNITPGYYNVGFKRGKAAQDEEVYEEIGGAHA